MRSLFVAVIIVLACFAAAFGAEIGSSRNVRATGERYTTKYDNIDVDRILHSRRLLLNYVNCLLDKGPCSPEGRELRKYMPDALATSCSKCSDIQKKQAGKIFSFLLLNYRNEWNQLVDKYDKDGVYRKMYSVDEDNEEDYKDLDQV